MDAREQRTRQPGREESGRGPEVTYDLIARVGAGDSSAWSRLVQRCGDRLRVLMHYRVDPSSRAAHGEDLLQETWVQAIRSLDSFEYRGEGSFQRWLAGILRMKIHELHRAGKRPWAAAGFDNASAGTNPVGLLDALIDTQTPSRNAWERDRVRRVREVLDTLPDTEREALLARYYEGLTLREVGERIGADPATVLHRERRGLARCARAMGPS